MENSNEFKQVESIVLSRTAHKFSKGQFTYWRIIRFEGWESYSFHADNPFVQFEAITQADYRKSCAELALWPRSFEDHGDTTSLCFWNIEEEEFYGSLA